MPAVADKLVIRIPVYRSMDGGGRVDELGICDRNIAFPGRF